jgi:hypothetical protein
MSVSVKLPVTTSRCVLFKWEGWCFKQLSHSRTHASNITFGLIDIIAACSLACTRARRGGDPAVGIIMTESTEPEPPSLPPRVCGWVGVGVARGDAVLAAVMIILEKNKRLTSTLLMMTFTLAP